MAKEGLKRLLTSRLKPCPYEAAGFSAIASIPGRTGYKEIQRFLKRSFESTASY
jgi:hypothetical protein